MNPEKDLEAKALGEIIEEFTEAYIKLAEKMLKLAETLWGLWLQEEGREEER